jgi:septum formation topological specificity factor MinE
MATFTPAETASRSGSTIETIPDRLALLEAHERSVAANIVLLQKQQRHLKEKIARYRELV